MSDNNCLKIIKIKNISNWDPNMWLPVKNFVWKITLIFYPIKISKTHQNLKKIAIETPTCDFRFKGLSMENKMNCLSNQNLLSTSNNFKYTNINYQKLFDVGQREVIVLLTLITNKAEHSIFSQGK